jgi:hypothetical protein
MQLSKETLNLFENFSSINGSLLLKTGSKITTIAESKNVVADVTVSETFPVEFGIYDLKEFLGVISLFDKPELDFSNKYVVISDGGKSQIKYFAAGEGVVKSAPTNVKFPSADVEFDLTSAQLAMIRRTSGVLKANDLAIVGSDGKLKLVVADKKNDTSNAYEVVIGETDETFKANLQVDNLKMLPGDYTVSISKKRISRFTNKSNDLTYFVAIESDSEF